MDRWVGPAWWVLSASTTIWTLMAPAGHLSKVLPGEMGSYRR